MAQRSAYFIPTNSPWPMVGCVGIFCTLFGAAHWLNHSHGIGQPLFYAGIAVLLFMMFGWFRSVIHESLKGNYNDQVDTSFRMGMMWFIFSEVMFFGAFFGALFYARILSVPWIGGEGHGILTNAYLWPQYSPAWPTNGPANIGGDFQPMGAWGLALLNTVLLLTSSVTVTIAHHALRSGHRGRLKVFLALTFILGALFVYSQANEYAEAYEHLNLTLQSGIYGSTFFLLTGFHGCHVIIGTTMLIVIWIRVMKGHFDKDNHFAFEAVAWYWHFVDVVWLNLFVFVYVL
ncbi:MAG TPA: cytochrome c oxidase subunit 3 [Oleiagrimonas sp.]|nr:cytochrome c oxidase subunit 3 [Oleiagrimonas sp.]